MMGNARPTARGAAQSSSIDEEEPLHAPWLRDAPRQIVLLLSAVAIALAATPVAGAQSARTAVTVPVALFTRPSDPGAARNTARCVATLATVVPVRAQNDSGSAVTEADSIADDGADLDGSSAGSGMVVVDSHGRIINPDTSRRASGDVAREGCCVTPMPAIVWARWSTAGYELSTGNGTRERCVDAMNPPPSSRSPQ